MAKSLAQFKRDIDTGMHIEYIECKQREFDSLKQTYVGEWYEVPVPPLMAGIRYVSYKDTTGFYLKRPDDQKIKGIFCEYPKADDLAYINDNFTIVDKASDGEPYQMRTYKIIRFN